MDEFSLIGAYFKRAISPSKTPQMDVGVGDDAALFRVADGHQCVVSSDLLIEGRHFFADVAPRALGHKSLAVNLSDLAAMGAQPLGFTLSIGLPRVDTEWLSEFSKGLFALADEFNCPLIGGDTTQSDTIVINITIFGQVPTGQAILRSGAQVGDDVWVTGTLGDAAYALNLMQNAPTHSDLAQVRARLEMPTPHVAFACALRSAGLAHSMLDVSDGLAGDLPHILRASNVSARIDCDALPQSSVLSQLPAAQAWQYAVAGGDDYELCLTASATSEVRAALFDLAQKFATPITRVGTITPMNQENQVIWHSERAPEVAQRLACSNGFNHFASH
ncbi:MAG: thiL [Burkholderiaceae bacterium]|nr:thiL [Burkholderiaceae bacterium]